MVFALSRASGIQRARALLQEFKYVLLAEIDYAREAANIKLFRSTFADDNGFKKSKGVICGFGRDSKT
jgi:predicted unusual protein kinase regulating ubiquinone biosynthesis (AarF/ABC1/UbiB family)